MEENNIFILKKFEILKELKKEFLNEIKLLFVFKVNKSKINVLITTKDDRVFAFGYNDNGVLGLGHQNSVQKFTFNDDLSNKQIIDYRNGGHHIIARTCGKVEYFRSN